MTRFEHKTSPVLYGVMSVATVAVFAADIITPLGTADWIFYLVPVGLSFFFWRPAVPVVVGMLSSVLTIAGYFLSPPGVGILIARANRGIGIATIWILVGVGYEFIRNKLIVRKDQWLQSGQTGLSEKMRGEQSLKALGENVLSFLAEYLEARGGAFFIEENGSFRRFALYAAPASGSVPEVINPGEGLPGQAIKDRRTFIMNEVPEGYFSIGSALGHSGPRHLLVAPVTADGVVNGVLELALAHPAYGSDAELLERVAESIGIAIRSSKDRTRLHELLEETQRQGEELQAQSEELRVSNEELAEQSRALKESQTRLELQQTEMEQTNQQLEEQTQILEAQKEDLNGAKSQLELQTRQLEQISRYKSDFLANMSHELRTPLNSSLILARLLAENRQGNLTAEQVQYAQTIESAGNDLLALITDILDLSKIEAGRMELKRERVPLRRLIDSLMRMILPLARHKALEFRTEIRPDAPESLETDAQRLEQVLKNILSNAVKFTERGEVILEVDRSSGGMVTFVVRDTGIGISPQEQQIIFEPFRQADGTTNRKHGGTGLGLSISRELAQLLGGRIEVSSELGRGSTFTVLLPEVCSETRVPARSDLEPVEWPADSSLKPAVQLTPAAAVRPVSAPRIPDDRERLTGAGRIILAVEDDESFARILFDLAHELGFQCLIATTAEEGMALATQFVPQAVLLDIGLPDNSGLTVLGRLKRDARTRHIPVHVISASDHTQTAMAMGAAGYILKPVKREQLVQAFKQLETRFTQGLRRVLVVEDDPVQLDSMRRLLSLRDVETLGASTVSECLGILRTRNVDCMVLDLNLPDASGFALLETLSHEDAYPFSPVIVYTGRELTADEEQRLRKYSKSIIIKGAKSPERLLDEVTLFLHQVLSELPPEKQQMLEQAHSREAALEGRRILIVEDDVRNVFALTSILEPKGARVQIARNGREALAALEASTRDPAQRVNLVLMDIMMPEMDGFTAIREIRKRPEWKKLPIIALTAKAMKSDQEQCLAAGANDYVAKPLEVEKLLSLVRVWMPR